MKFKRDKEGIIRIPRRNRDVYFEYVRYINEGLSEKEILEKMKINRKQLDEIKITESFYKPDTIDKKMYNKKTDINIKESLICEEPSKFIEVEMAMFLESILKDLNEEERKILELRLKGKRQVDVAREIGYSQMTISRRLEKLGNKIKKLL